MNEGISDEAGASEPGPYGGWAVRVAIWVSNGSFCAAVGWALYAFFWDAGWLMFWPFAATWLGLYGALEMPIWRAKLETRRLRRSVEKNRAETLRLRAEVIQLQILATQKRAHLAAVRAEKVELERMLLQRQIGLEAREARRRLDIACAAIEADRLEAAAWRLEIQAKHLEIKLGQAELFESLAVIDDNAQDRIIAAYQKGFDHGQQGIVVPINQLRHLRVVEESA